MPVNLIKLVRGEIEAFFQYHQNIVFNNERQLQTYLYIWLNQHIPLHEGYKNAIIHAEYYVPIEVFPSKQIVYPWGKKDRMYIDLVVECDGEFLPIELKYKTESIKDAPLSRFNENVGITSLLSDQIATNLGYYECWQDVKRLELLAQRFVKINHGLFVFLTNNHLYLNGPQRSNCLSGNFAWKECDVTHATMEKNWPDGIQYENRPNLTFAQPYPVKWHQINSPIDPEQARIFKYCIIEVDAATVRAAHQSSNIHSL